MVGCVIVSPDGAVVGAAYHARAGDPHAEILALRQAGARSRGATLYCSLEPCAHTGRTGPCAVAVADAGVARVVAAVEDPDPRVSGRGLAYLRARGVDVRVGVCAREAAALNRAFFTAVTRGRPFVTIKVATSLDARVAAVGGRRTAITSGPANDDVHALRAEVDAIAVGVGTVLADDPLLTARGVERRRPLLRVVFDGRLRTPVRARLLATLASGPVVVVTSEAGLAAAPARAEALRGAGAELVALPPRALGPALAALGSRAVRWLLIEGGPTLHAAAWRAGVVDHVRVYVAPLVLGPAGVAWAMPPGFSTAGLDDHHAEPFGPDVRIDGYVHRTH